jgi:hypothetical protein
VGRPWHRCENIETDIKEKEMFECGMDSAGSEYGSGMGY